MNGRAHTALGVGAALTVCNALQLTNSLEHIDKIIVCGAISAVAATLPDIDVGAAKKVYKGSIYGLLGVFGLVCFYLLTKGTLSKVPISIVGILGFSVLSIFGQKQPHRGFTHSAVAFCLFTLSCAVIILPVSKEYGLLAVISFATAYASHLLIDILNRKGEQLLYPLPGRYCLKLCTANGFGNECTFVVGLVLCFFNIARLII